MHIKSYNTSRFAGLRDIDLRFEDGINVILGDNESGKSTIIEGIHSLLFKGVRLKKNNNKDRDFSFKFMPKPNGDFIDGKLVINTLEGDYELSKEWGSSESVSLLRPNGNIIKNEDDINKQLAKLLDYGESTYSNIVFAKQRDLKVALNNILENKDISMEINTVLRKVLMELDGISLDEIQKNIEEEIEGLYKRWNREKNYPENNRGVNNPYKTGIGKILESYYNMENIKLMMDKAYRSEDEFEKVCEDIKVLNEKNNTYKNERIELEKIEGDINTREISQTKLENISIKLKDLKDINSKWPSTIEGLKNSEEDLEKIKRGKESLLEEKINLEKMEKKQLLGDRLKKMEKINEEISLLKDEIHKKDIIKIEDINRLEEINNRLIEINATIRAGNLFLTLKKTGDKSIYISKDFKEKEVLKINEEVRSEGIIKLYYGDEFEVEVKSGEIEYQSLNEENNILREEYEEILNSLNVDSIKKLKSEFQLLNDMKGRLKELNSLLELNLEGNNLEDLAREHDELEEIKVFKSLNQLEMEIADLNKREIQVLTEIGTKKSNLTNWKDKYESHENLLGLLLTEMSNLKEEEDKLNTLSPLPERFSTIEEFKERLSFLKINLEELSLRLGQANEEYYIAKGNLLDESYEELKKQYEDSKDAFEKNMNRGERLLKIYEVFLETKERLSKNPMEPLVREFTGLLDIITDGKYKNGQIDEDFNISIENINGEIPIELLSAGTYDAVALALRFSLLKHIFPDRKAYLVLDDCLVDLDPKRKIQSINLIKRFSKDYQIIFTTCDPETASMLGGNLIKL